MPADAPEAAQDRWGDVEGRRIALFWVEQVAEPPEHGALLPRLHQHGQVLGRGPDVLYARFVGECQLISVAPPAPAPAPRRTGRTLVVTVPRSREEGLRQLSTQTLAWLASRPPVRRMVRSVWATLADLERDGHDPGALAALRSVLIKHQPATRAGRCRACRRLSWRRLWRRRTFPCPVWMTTHIELQGRPHHTRRC